MNNLSKSWFKSSYADRHRRAKMAWMSLNNDKLRAKYGLMPVGGDANHLLNSERLGANPHGVATLLQVGRPVTTMSEWFHIEYKIALDEFDDAFVDWEDEPIRTPVKIQRLKAAFKIFAPKHKALYAFVKHHPLTKSEDLVAMGFPYCEHSRVSSPAPSTFPVAILIRKATGVIEIQYFDGKTKKRGKPHGIYGAEIRWSLLINNPNNDYSLLLNSEISIVSPFVLHFGPEDYGKTLYCVLRWENYIGVKGGYSEVYSIIVG